MDEGRATRGLYQDALAALLLHHGREAMSEEAWAMSDAVVGRLRVVAGGGEDPGTPYADAYDDGVQDGIKQMAIEGLRASQLREAAEALRQEAGERSLAELLEREAHRLDEMLMRHIRAQGFPNGTIVGACEWCWGVFEVPAVGVGKCDCGRTRATRMGSADQEPGLVSEEVAAQITAALTADPAPQPRFWRCSRCGSVLDREVAERAGVWSGRCIALRGFGRLAVPCSGPLVPTTAPEPEDWPETLGDAEAARDDGTGS